MKFGFIQTEKATYPVQVRYIRHHNKHAKPIRWTYRDTSRRITYDAAVTSH